MYRYQIKGRRIESPANLELNCIYVMDNEIYELVYIGKNRFVFRNEIGTEYINRSMLETRIKQGLFKVIE